LRIHLLATEVVNDEEPVIGFHLQGGFIEFGDAVEFQVEHTQGQFATSHNDGTLDSDPALIYILYSYIILWKVLNGNVVYRVKNGDDLTSHVKGMGNKNSFWQNLANSLSNCCFAIAGRAEDEHWRTGTDCRTESSEHVLADNNLGKGRMYHVVIDSDILDRLVLNHFPVIFKCDRCRSDIATNLH